MDDAWDAFEYVVRNLPTIMPKHMTPVRLVVSGTSSGGQLAAIVSQRARDWLRDSRNAAVAANIILSGVLLRAPVTVRGTDGAFIPPAFRELHQSWAEELETNLDRLGMAENHGLNSSQWLPRMSTLCNADHRLLRSAWCSNRRKDTA
jgi:acetyl esterase/lipase